jgi:undecaprenyl-phosphate 4-deoxy-4-formamido-L-arabinose transferase
MQAIQYSIVVPVFNSVRTLEPLYHGIAEVMDTLNMKFEVIFVEDRGKEDSWQELIRLKKSFSQHITIIRLSKNFGQNGATLCGINQAKGQYIITMDDDLQVHPREIINLIDHMKDHDSEVVYGQMRDLSPMRIRVLGGRILKKVFERMDQGGDIGSSFRLIAPSMVPLLKQHSQDHLYINQVLSWYTHDIGLVGVASQQRNEGVSNYSIWQLVKIGFRLIFYYSSIPLLMISYASIFCAITCFLIALYYVYKKLTIGAEIGFTATIVAIFSVAGIILLSISVLSAYVNRIYHARIKKPHYHIKVIK